MPNRYGEEDDWGAVFFSSAGSLAAAAWSSSFSPPPFSFPPLDLSVWLVKPPVAMGHWKGARAPGVPFYRELMSMAADGG